MTRQREKVQNAILNTLRTYPNIPIAMLSTSVRPYARDWRLVLEAMVLKGEVVRELRPTGQGSRCTMVYRVAAVGAAEVEQVA
jgi:hypothetical protein